MHSFHATLIIMKCHSSRIFLRALVVQTANPCLNRVALVLAKLLAHKPFRTCPPSSCTLTNHLVIPLFLWLPGYHICYKHLLSMLSLVTAAAVLIPLSLLDLQAFQKWAINLKMDPKHCKWRWVLVSVRGTQSFSKKRFSLWSCHGCAVTGCGNWKRFVTGPVWPLG